MDISTLTPLGSLAGIEFDRPRLRPVAFNAYSDIHKAIRAELFDVTTAAGRADVADDFDMAALAGQVAGVSRLLAEHARHEDDHVQPVIVAHLPDLAAQIEHDHSRFEPRFAQVESIATELSAMPGAERREAAYELYVELSFFTGAYLAHQDLEERLVMPALEAAIGVDGVLDIHMSIVGSMPPDEMMRGLAAMLPAINIDDRAGIFGGIHTTAPAEVFAAVWDLARSVLPSIELDRLATRLDLAA